MSRTSLAVQEQFSKISGQKLSVSKISVPNTTIVGRAQINDLANDASLSFGLNRITTQRLYQIPSEIGSNGEFVFGVLGDTYDQIRFVGNWSSTNTTNGIYVSSGVGTTPYVEITFYGTGLNMLSILNGATFNYVASVDGGAETANLAGLSYSNLLQQRNYSPNQILPIVSGLSLGLHTVKIRNNTGSNEIPCYGFEVLNQSTTLDVRPGSLLKDAKKFNLISSSFPAYASDFESGTVGTKGGRVLAYLKADGTIGKAISPAASSQSNLGSADHTNEDLAKTYSFREFGANRADDFSTVTSTPSARAFTLNDGTTTLSATSVTASFITSIEGFGLNAASDFFTITFVGTGLDILNVRGAAVTDTFSIAVDGVSIGTGLSSYFGTGLNNIVKVVSGLPYGTHTVKITRTTAVGVGLFVGAFLVYQPKKPALPVNAVEIGEYFLMADYSYMSAFSTDSMSQGVLQKASSRETALVNTWLSVSLSPTAVSTGNAVTTQTVGAYAEFTFFGTGFNMRTYRDTNLVTSSSVLIDGVALNTSNFTISHNGGGASGSGPAVDTRDNAIAFTPSTGVLNLNGATALGQGVFVLTGLPLGKHTVRFTHGAGTNLVIAALDVITPVYFPKLNDFALQSSSPVGNSAIGDLRETIVDSDKAKVLTAQGITSNPTTTSTVLVPMPEMSLSYQSDGEWVEINFYGVVLNSNAGVAVTVAPFVNGQQVQTISRMNAPSSGLEVPINFSIPVYLPKGFHKIDAYWSVAANTGTTTLRQLSAKKIGK